ncbi:acyl-CoA dehydrogenase family protein [Couchioplanes caeruleus]|uniref:Acyl-CoA dehydrogenase n=2 Tax=Couchioplanes caeruleus TaxID=56438 RepID=A0A1K0FQT4_9ACTN|nr:acyl-CoA dehydrogenase family protein [Couchioplanes caeruleus]OJF15191.1 acyl-CoA dehydrogenase [Couchioplanes caeruleus subsp. caeruleus]ROP28029.1 alkylation response protein AidB-like acyl-CoA dehydrogenase [Couchioplanes caeruleus]
MDFSLSDEARELAALTRDLAASGRPLWPALADAGVLAAALPKRAGGEGYGLLEQCAILIELGRAAAAVPYLPSIVVAAGTLARFGTEEQVTEWAVPASRGEVVLTATAGTVRAERVKQGWRLDGTIPAVPAAIAASMLLVPTEAGIFLVRPDDDGVAVEEQHVAGGPGAGLLRCDGTVVPGDRLLADPAPRAWLGAYATVGTCAAQLGVVERALEMTAEYARTRVQFERPIGAFQAVAQRLADAYIDVEALRVALWQAAWRLSEHPGAAAEVATAGFWAAEAGHRVAHTAVHVHGGVGIDVEYPLHRYFLAAKYHEFLLGGATAQLLALGDTLRSPVERVGVFE